MESRMTGTKTRRKAARPAAQPVERMTAALVTAEAAPFAVVGGLAEVVPALAGALGARGVDACIIMPHYPRLMPAGIPLQPWSSVEVPGPWATPRAGIWRATLPGADVPVYFIAADEYFDRPGVYTDPESGQGFGDNAERFAFFSRAAFEFMRSMPAPPDVVHLHDHHAAPLAVPLRGAGMDAGALAGTGLVLTIHNLAFQGIHPGDEAIRLGVPHEMLSWGGPLEFYGQANYLKGAIELADVITTVSPSHAADIRSDATLGCGLEGVLAARGNDVVGILNGVDYRAWNPSDDPWLGEHYDRNRLAGKAACRKALLETMGLPASAKRGRAVLGMVSRFIESKGLDLLAEVAPELVKRNVQLALVGSGDPHYHDVLERLQASHPAEVAVRFGVDEALAHRVIAGSDIHLMPSRYEAFGATQVYALRYGTIPVVHAAGGLADTVVDCDARPAEGTGFRFDRYCGDAFLDAVDRALAAYHDARRWRTIVRRAMGADFGWEGPAAAYRAVYETARNRDAATRVGDGNRLVVSGV